MANLRCGKRFSSLDLMSGHQFKANPVGIKVRHTLITQEGSRFSIL